MASPLRFHRLVASDLRDAVRWYDQRSPSAGNRFRAAVKAAWRQIEKFPTAFPYVDPERTVRFYRIRQFPYLVLYRVERHGIVVLGVYHSASNPERWRERIASS